MSKPVVSSSITGGLSQGPTKNPTNIVRHGDEHQNTKASPRKAKSAPAWDSDTTGASLPRLKVPC